MIGFFHENEEYGCLSNWYPAEFDYVRHFTSSEQFMMYHKVLMFRKYDLAEQILKIRSREVQEECWTKVSGIQCGCLGKDLLYHCKAWSQSEVCSK